jgi:hypothetical protein
MECWGSKYHVPVLIGICLQRQRPDRIWGPPSALFNGYRASFPGSEVDHSRPSTAVVKSEWSYTSAPPIRLRGVDRGNFIFTFTGRY